MGMSWLAMISLTLASIFPNFKLLSEFSASLYQISFSSMGSLLFVISAFYYGNRDTLTYETANFSWKVDLMTFFDNIVFDSFILDWALNSILFNFNSINILT